MSDINERMSKAIDSVRRNFSTVRTGRANPEILNNVKVEAYGSLLPLNQVATVSVRDSNVLVIAPFDKSTMPEIERGIVKAALGLTPNNDGLNIRLSIPPLTEERRKELDKVIKKMAEEGRVGIRNIRRDNMDSIKKDEDLSDDEKKGEEAGIQKITDSYIKQVDEILKVKENEIMEI
jgi:ribosome recycling factor